MASRELRYWRARRASAEVVKPSEDKSKASFGMRVTLRRDDGREQIFRIVGEDEADPSRGTVSYVSLLARAVLTHLRARRLCSPTVRPSFLTCGERPASNLLGHSLEIFEKDHRHSATY